MPKKGRKKQTHTAKDYAEALRNAGGWKSRAAKLLGVRPSAVTAALKRHPKLNEVIKEVQESYLDLAEDNIITILKDPSHRNHMGATCFYLKCQGKDRGWYEKQEHKYDVPEGLLLNINLTGRQK